MKAIPLDGLVAAEWVRHCLDLQAQIAKLKAEYEHGAAIIQETMTAEGADEATLGGRTAVTWRTGSASYYVDVKRLLAERPDVHAEYSKQRQPSRPFRVVAP